MPNSSGKVVISTQAQWLENRPVSNSEDAMRDFLRSFRFDPEARIKQTGKVIDEKLMPQAGTIRRQILETCMVSGRTVQEVNEDAKEIRRQSVRPDADLFKSLYIGYIQLA
jgi:hypothetical protein